MLEEKPVGHTEGFEDNLPFQGEVYAKGDVRVYIYEGYHVSDTQRCAVRVKGEDRLVWMDRSVLTPVSEAQ